MLLAQEGVPVLVHGPLRDPGRVTSAEVVRRSRACRLRASADDIQDAWRGSEPAFISTEALCPPLARLLDVRWVDRAAQPRPYGGQAADAPVAALPARHEPHPPRVRRAAAALYRAAPHANAMLLRGTEGEPVADPRRLPRLDVFIGGVERGRTVAAGARRRADRAAAAAARMRRRHDCAVHPVGRSGEKPAPRPLMQQVQTLLETLAAMVEPAASADNSTAVTVSASASAAGPPLRA